MLTNSCVKLQTVHSIPLTINKEGGPPPFLLSVSWDRGCPFGRNVCAAYGALASPQAAAAEETGNLPQPQAPQAPCALGPGRSPGPPLRTPASSFTLGCAAFCTHCPTHWCTLGHTHRCVPVHMCAHSPIHVTHCPDPSPVVLITFHLSLWSACVVNTTRSQGPQDRGHRACFWSVTSP